MARLERPHHSVKAIRIESNTKVHDHSAGLLREPVAISTAVAGSATSAVREDL